MLRLILTLILCSLVQDYGLEATDVPALEETNPFLEAAKSFLEEAIEKNPEIGKSGGMAALSGILHSLKDGKQLGDLLSGFNAASSGSNGNVASDILTGIAGMLSKNSQGFDPKVIGQVADVLSSLASDKVNDPSTNEIPDHNSGPDWSAILGLASNLLASATSGKTNGNNEGEGGFENLLKGGGLEGLMNLLPLLTSSAPSGHVHFADSELEDKSEHKKYEKSNYLPPFMHIIYEYWEHFKKSEFGETIWRKSGLEAIFQLFIDKDGYFQVDRIFESMENNSFRRKWIKSLSSFVGEWVKHISDPTTQARYVANVKYFGNSFLSSQGYSKAIHFDPLRPTESIASIMDAIFRRNFGLKINSGKYIRPAILYIQDLFKLGDGKNFLNVSHLSSKEISSKLSELLNGELIEPILRVWRAYKFSIKHPQCDKRLICYLNQKDGQPNKTGLKPGVTKLSSLIASWYLSGRTGTPFWKFYNAATEDIVCETQYPADCQLFFDEEWRIATQSGHGDEL